MPARPAAAAPGWPRTVTHSERGLSPIRRHGDPRLGRQRRQRGAGRVIAVLTAAFVASAVSGVARGIQWLSNTNMVLAVVLAVFVFVVGPTVFVLNLLPAAIGVWTALDAVQGLLVCLLGLCALSTWLVLRLARSVAAPIEAACIGIAVPLLTLAAGYDFGQREHLMAVAALPYLFLAARRIEGASTGPGLTVGAAVLAAIGFALKPHFLAIPGLVEALVLIATLRAVARLDLTRREALSTIVAGEEQMSVRVLAPQPRVRN